MVKKRNFKKKSSEAWYNKKYSPMDIAQKAWKGVKIIKGLINVEKKMWDMSVSGVITDGAGSLQLLTGISIGDNYNQRDGNSVKLQSNYFVMRVFNNPAASFSNIRFVLVQDNEYNGTALTTAQILEVATAPASLVAPLNHTIGSRLNILYDKYISLGGAGQNTAIVEQYTTFNESHIKFNDANITTTTLREGHLYMLLISDVGANYPGYDYYNRVRYTDN